MENPRPDKVAVVDEVKQKFGDAEAAVLTEYRGLDVDAMQALRRALREAGGEYKVYKNTLVRLAADALDLEIEDLLTGPTAIAFVTETPSGEPGDAVNVAKALKTFAKEHPALVVKGGLLGEKLLDAAEVDALAEVAPREELLARLAGGLAAPMQRFAGLLQAVPRDFAYALQALIAEGGAAGAPEADAGPDGGADEPQPEPESGDAAAEADAPAEAPAAEAATDAPEADPAAASDDGADQAPTPEAAASDPAEASAEADSNDDAADAADESE